MSSVENIRAFLAIEPPDNVLRTVCRLQEKLQTEIGGRVSWTKPSGQHLTLKFFGDISVEDVDQISHAVQNRVSPGWSLRLQIAKLGVFTDIRKPRVLWCGIEGDVAGLAALHKQLDNDFKGIGFPPEDRPFRAHLTLARIKDSHSLTRLDEALKKHAAFCAGDFTVRELVLFQSKLTPHGAVYTRLTEFPQGIKIT